MKNLFYIHRFPFNKESFLRDEFQYFISKGYNVKYLDVTSLLKRKDLGINCPEYLLEYIITFNDKKSFRNFLKINNKDTLIVTDVGLLSNSAWMYLAIFNANLPYMLFENSVLPKIRNIDSSIKKIGFLKFLKRFSYSKIYKKPFEVITYLIAKSKMFPATMIITSKKRLSSEKQGLNGKGTIIKYSMNMDFKAAMEVGSEVTVKKPYAVFIDQYFVHHPDFKTNHIVHFFSADEYYGELNKFLLDFSKETGLKIVIASHPRRSKEQEKDFYSEFDVYYNKTAELIKNSKVVLIHFSTAINFAVIFKKPFLLLNSSLFKNSSVDSEIRIFSNYFRKNMISTSNYNDILNTIKDDLDSVDEIKYEEFLNSYIKHPKAKDETFKEQIESVLKRLDK